MELEEPGFQDDDELIDFIEEDGPEQNTEQAMQGDPEAQRSQGKAKQRPRQHPIGAPSGRQPICVSTVAQCVCVHSSQMFPSALRLLAFILVDLRKQTLLTLADTVIQARRDAAIKLIVYGFPSAEKQNKDKRDKVVAELAAQSGMKPLHVQHSVREDSLSDFSVLTYSNSGQRKKVIDSRKGKKLSFPGDARAEPKIKPQVCLCDRLKAVPLKAIMHRSSYSRSYT
eukprot:6490374-Amphidinium_carterae.2